MGTSTLFHTLNFSAESKSRSIYIYIYISFCIACWGLAGFACLGCGWPVGLFVLVVLLFGVAGCWFGGCCLLLSLFALFVLVSVGRAWFAWFLLLGCLLGCLLLRACLLWLFALGSCSVCARTSHFSHISRRGWRPR